MHNQCYKAIPGNDKIVHHVALFLAKKELDTQLTKMENEDSEIGYKCFGGPFTAGNSVPMSFIGAIGPGNNNFVTPEGSGMPLPEGAKIVMQVHYSLHGVASTEPQSDQTTIKLQLSEENLVPGYFATVMDSAWALNPKSMAIPAGAVNHEIKYEGTPFADTDIMKLILAPELDSKTGVDIYATFPHMHTRGRKLQLSVVLADQSLEPIFSVSDWDFHWQSGFVYKNKITVLPTDKMQLKCYFDNTLESMPHYHGPTPELKEVTWGESTVDEMCVATVYVTKKDALHPAKL